MKKILGLMAVAVLVFAPMAGAGTLFNFTTSGTASGNLVSGTASFSFTGSQLVITLTNTTADLGHISQLLDGISWSGFALTGAPAVAPAGVVNCHEYAGSACPAYVAASSPYGWGLAGSEGTLLAAGGGSYKPYAILSDDYTTPGGSGGLSNSQHNPLLLGPVTFTFGYSGVVPTELSNVEFYWGTVPDITNSTVPEPASMLLLGSGLLGAGFFGRRRKKN